MGISIGHNWSCSSYDTPKVVEKIVEVPLPNPNPKNFTILQRKSIGRFLILLVNYPDCTNYEGNKILMYDGAISVEELIKQGSIDPHFSDNGWRLSPVARFEPTIKGWKMAEKLANVY